MKSVTEATNIKNGGNVPASASLQKRALAAARILISHFAATTKHAFLSNLYVFY